MSRPVSCVESNRFVAGMQAAVLLNRVKVRKSNTKHCHDNINL